MRRPTRARPRTRQRPAIQTAALLAWLATFPLALCTACGPEREPADTIPQAPASPGERAGGEDRSGPTSAPPRLIILVSIDTLRADHLGLYGYERFTSPILDAVALEGTVFDDASATSPWTLPSHASMLTGLYPLSHRVLTYGTALPSDVPTLASMLAAAGYETAAVVNTLWLKKDRYRVTRDFEKYLYVESKLDRRAPNNLVTDQALDWIAELGDRRLFLFVHYFDVHTDYASEPAYERLFVRPYEGVADGSGWQLMLADFEESFIEFCKRDFDPHKCTFGNVYTIDETVEKLYFDARDIQHIVDLYDAGIRQLDTELGRLFGSLDERGLEDETLLVVTSDHGEEFYEHGHYEHFLATYQEVLRVPLILRGPGIPSGLRVSEPVSAVDLAPTILGLAGLPAPASLEGLDLSPLWRGGDPAPFRTRLLHGEASGGLTYQDYAEGFFPIYRAIRRGRHKLVYESKGGTHALYDLTADPGETTDISASEPEIARELRERMRERYADFDLAPQPDSRVELEQEEIDQLRALGYVP